MSVINQESDQDISSSHSMAPMNKNEDQIQYEKTPFKEGLSNDELYFNLIEDNKFLSPKRAKNQIMDLEEIENKEMMT